MYSLQLYILKTERPIRALLNSMLSYKKLKGKPPLVYYLRALGSTIYSLIAKEDRLKLAKYTL